MSEVQEVVRTASGKDITPTWIINKYGVKSCVPRHIAEDFVNKNVDFRYAEADFVPVEKQYPMDGEFTENGLKNRLAILEKRVKMAELIKSTAPVVQPVTTTASTEFSAETFGIAQLRAMAKEKGITVFQKGKEQLIKELGL